LDIQQVYEQFIAGMKQTGWIEYIAVFAGIISVWYSRKENILVYPTGLLNTILYIYLSLKIGLLGEASVNFYYTVMSIYGWVMWSKKNNQHENVVRITRASVKEWRYHLLFFAAFYVVLYFAIGWMSSKNYIQGAIPWADAFASATAYTGMWLMTRKKVESWYWWIATNIASIPLYFVKQYVFTSVYYIVLLVMAVFGLLEWIKKSKLNKL
jgi:nicotinamide mononucleotide transporter